MIKLAVFLALLTVATVNANTPILTLFRRNFGGFVKDNLVLKTITQRLDNFDRRNEVTWEQRYYVDDQFYAPGGPIFVLLSGFWNITPYRMSVSALSDLAEKLHGIIFNLEHRFYGESRPTKDTSVENLRFLTVEQALADTAHFISYVTSDEVTPGENSAVIVVGANYAGSLAVWFRQKYPMLATGAWATGAPLQGLVNFQQYKELAGEAYLEVGGEDCYRTVEEGFRSLERYLADGNNGYVEEVFSACDPIATDADIRIFIQLVSELFTMIPELNHIYPLHGVCDTITNGTAESEIHKIAQHINNVFERFFEGSCVPSSYEAIVKLLSQTDWNASVNELALRPYAYQLCDQLGWFHSSNSQFQPFGSSLDHSWWYGICAHIFGEEFTEETIESNVARLNTVFGAINPAVSNTIFVHGDLDPWRQVGVQTQLNPSSHKIIISGSSQAVNNLKIHEEKDSPQLSAAKRKILEIITGWVESV